MNREKQMVKDLENKQAQAREHYAKNKALLEEDKVKEKSASFNFTHKKNKTQEGEEEI
ncbi:MAG: hypothetical protein LIP08_12035 [Bacteroides sp.]|nr:hypothetical protein [Bacteroides sp.]